MILVTLLQETGPFNVELLLSAPSLFQGVAAFLWVPLSLAVGRRPTLLLASFTLLIATIWAGASASFVSLLAAVCLMGTVLGAAMSVVSLLALHNFTNLLTNKGVSRRHRPYIHPPKTPSDRHGLVGCRISQSCCLILFPRCKSNIGLAKILLHGNHTHHHLLLTCLLRLYRNLFYPSNSGF